MSFEVIPAIDLLQGTCVRLEQGDFTRVLTYSHDPVTEAKRFEQAGALRLHVVDLEGAKTGKPKEDKTIQKIVAGVGIPIQIGGGVRNYKKIEQLINLGVSRVILGTTALTDPGLVKKACKQWGNKVFISIDAKNGYVALEGWRKTSEVKAGDLARTAQDWGVGGILYTDIAKDGMLRGPNFNSIEALCKVTSVPILASGGISTMKDLERVYSMNTIGVIGCVVGKAFYAGSLLPENVFSSFGKKVLASN